MVAGLSAPALSGPVLDLYGDNPEVFLAGRAGRGEIVLFVLLVTLLAPAVAFLGLLVAERIGGRAPDIAYWTATATLGLAIGFVISRQAIPDSTLGAVGLAVAVAVPVFGFSRRFEGPLAWFACALPAVPALFLFASTAGRLVWSQPEAEVSGGAAHIGAPAPIVMLQLDELPTASIMRPDGEINAALFPNFARLADGGTWYRNALSSSIATTQSVPAILTGRLGKKGMVASAVDHPDNLFTLLAGSHEMHVIEWVVDLCPDNICPDYAGRAPPRFMGLVADALVVYGHLTFPGSSRDALAPIDNAWNGFLRRTDSGRGPGVRVDSVPVPSGPDRVNWVNWMQRIINGIGGVGRPVLSYAHLQAPHIPWATNPSGRHYDRPEQYTEVEGVEGNGVWGADESAALMGFQRHLYQVGFLDTMLGEVFRRLDETGTWDETMVIVVADHGASFTPGEHRRWPYEDNRDDLYRAPMFVKYPHQREGRTVDEPAYGIDLLPTVVDALEITTDWMFDGASLLEIAGTDRPHEPIWWCCSDDPASTDLSALIALVERNHEWVPDQGSWLGVAGAGPFSGLVGQPAAALDIVSDDALTWSLDLGSSLSDVDLSSGKVQTILTGRVQLPEGLEPDHLIVVVNEAVAGVGYVNRDAAGGGAIRGLIAEELVRPGRNEIDILIPDGDRWVSGSAGVVKLQLRDNDGRLLSLTSEGDRRVQVDEVAAGDSGWTVTGWAADVRAKETPDAIYVFAGSELLAFGPPNVDNKNVVKWFKSERLLASGFSFEIDGSDVPHDVDLLTVVAEFGDEAISDSARLTD